MTDSSNNDATIDFPPIPGDPGKNLNKYFLGLFAQWDSDDQPTRLSPILKARIPTEAVARLLQVLQDERPEQFASVTPEQLKERICQAITIGDLADFFYKRNPGWEFWDELSEEANELSDHANLDWSDRLRITVAAFVQFVAGAIAHTNYRKRTSTHPRTIWRWVAWAVRAEDACDLDFMKETCELAEMGDIDKPNHNPMRTLTANATMDELTTLLELAPKLVKFFTNALTAQKKGDAA